MLHRFHKRMTILYTFTTGIILTAVMAVILIYSEKLLLVKSEEHFQDNFLTLVSKIQSGDIISHDWLSQMETDNNLIIHIEDNEIPLLFQGSWISSTDRAVLVQRTKEQAAQNHVNTAINPVSSGMQQTDLFRIQGDNHDAYHALVVTLPFDSGYKSLVLLGSLQPVHQAVLHQRVFFIALDIFGILALLVVSWFYTGKLLRPIQDSKEQQDSFIAAASHELRSPIAVIQASAGAITSNPNEARLLAGNILSECRRLSRLVQDLLELASADTASWSVEFCPVDVDTLLLNTYEAYENICLEKNITLTLSLPDDALPTVLGDKERLLQLLTILIDNAVTYSESDSSICIAAKSSQHAVLISIIDHGVGIPDEKKELVFHRFYRADDSRNDKSHFGLGLSIAAELAKLHKGHLSVTDTSGGGCTFTLKLPLGTG